MDFVLKMMNYVRYWRPPRWSSCWFWCWSRLRKTTRRATFCDWFSLLSDRCFDCSATKVGWLWLMNRDIIYLSGTVTFSSLVARWGEKSFFSIGKCGVFCWTMRAIPLKNMVCFIMQMQPHNLLDRLWCHPYRSCGWDNDRIAGEFCIKHDEFCIKNDAFRIKHDELCIKHDAFGLKWSWLYSKGWTLYYWSQYIEPAALTAHVATFPKRTMVRIPTVFRPFSRTEFGLFLDAQGTHLTIDAVAFLATASSASEASGKVIWTMIAPKWWIRC